MAKTYISKPIYLSTFGNLYKVTNRRHYFGCVDQHPFPKLKMGTKYKIHIQQHPKGNYWLREGIYGIEFKRNKKRISRVCVKEFIRVFGYDLYNEIQTVWTRYKVSFERVS